MKCWQLKPDGARCDSIEHLAADCIYNTKGRGKGRGNRNHAPINYVQTVEQLLIDTQEALEDEPRPTEYVFMTEATYSVDLSTESRWSGKAAALPLPAV